MIVMIVADQNKIDWRQVFESQARIPVSPRAYPRKRRAALGPDRIGQDVESRSLDQYRCVVNECISDTIGIHSLSGFFTVGGFDPIGPRLTLVGEEEFQESERAFGTPSFPRRGQGEVQTLPVPLPS